MTPQEINVKIAEVCGVKKCPGCGWERECPDHEHKLPNYYGDLNDCHEMEKFLKDDNTYYGVFCPIIRSVMGKNQRWESATAPQRCEAFLRTLGLWEAR